MMMKRFLMAIALGLVCWLAGPNAARAQSYFYGYYYPDEHRFNSPMLNTGIYDYSTITPMWNAMHDYQYGYPSRLWTVPTNWPLVPSGNPVPSPKAFSMNTPSPANIRVLVPSATAKVWFE